MGRKPAKSRAKKSVKLPKLRGRKPKMDIGPTDTVLIENRGDQITVSWNKPRATKNKQKLRLKKILQARGWSAMEIRDVVNEIWPRK